LRWTAGTAAVVVPIVVALSRLYGGVHHPTDILGSFLLAVLWVAAVWRIISPRAGDPTDARNEDGGLDAEGRR
jgi:undecaprenyl-diphosphatase